MGNENSTSKETQVPRVKPRKALENAVEEKSAVVYISTHGAANRFTNASEAHQMTSAIYPNLQNHLPSTSTGCSGNTTPGYYLGPTSPPSVPPQSSQQPHSIAFYSGPTSTPTAPPQSSQQPRSIVFYSEPTSSPFAPPQSSQQPHSIANQQNSYLEAVNCSSCRQELNGTVFLCVNRHPCCLACKNSSIVCMCRQAITDVRCHELESRFAKTNLNRNNEKRNCPNSNDGCTLSFYARDLAAHNKECPFNEMPCPVKMSDSCNWRGKLNHLKDHCKEYHPECVADVDKEMKLQNINEDSCTVYLVVLGKFHFLTSIKVDAQTNLIMMTAQLVGTKISAQKWSYEFHVFNKQIPRRKYQYNAVCHSNKKPIMEIFEKVDCAALNAIHAKSFAINGDLTYKFYLRKNCTNAREWRRKPVLK